MKHHQKILLATLLLTSFSSYPTGVNGMGFGGPGIVFLIFLMIFVPVSTILLFIGYVFKLNSKSTKDDLKENEVDLNSRAYYILLLILSLFISIFTFVGVVPL